MANLTNLRHRACINQSGLCCYCDCPMWEENPESIASLLGVKVSQVSLFQCTAEHRIPRCERGKNSAENIAAACRCCNSRRHTFKKPLSPEHYRQHVQNRMSKGRWHPYPVMKLLTQVRADAEETQKKARNKAGSS